MGFFLIILLAILSLNTYANTNESICYGTTSNGSLKNGVKLPSSGDNFTSYSSIAELAGRTYVHSEVRKIVLNAYKILKKNYPNKVFKYAETGFEKGGKFSPHKTHQNGLSVDFMVPVMNTKGKSVHLPTHAFNKFGYNIEFDKNGSYEDYTIDYEALAAHIVVLHKESRKISRNIWRVIYAPELQVNLLKTKYANYLKKNIQFSKNRSWIRHDEHYHVDFIIPCKYPPLSVAH